MSKAHVPRNMFPGNLLAPTPLYQNVFRGALGPAAFFLEGSAGRDRPGGAVQMSPGALHGFPPGSPHAALLQRQMLGAAGMAPLLVPVSGGGFPCSPAKMIAAQAAAMRAGDLSPPPLSPAGRGSRGRDTPSPDRTLDRTSSPPPATPKLKFGITSILSSDTSPKKTQPGESPI